MNLFGLFKTKKIRYVSEIDKFLKEFARQNKPSASQQAEIDKYKRVGELRSNPNAKENKKSKKSEIWEGF